MKWDGKVEVSGGYHRTGYDTTKWASSAKSAPILWPNPHAQLTFGIWGDTPTLAIGQAIKVNFLVGNWGSGPDTLCVVDENFLAPGKDRLYATVIARDRTGQPVSAKSEIKGHC
jgi:hypothetical protein